MIAVTAVSGQPGHAIALEAIAKIGQNDTVFNYARVYEPMSLKAMVEQYR